MNEATARLKINRLLERADWRFFPEGNRPANIQLEPGVALKPSDQDGLGDDFEKTGKGFVDYLLLDERGFPFIVLEAKSEEKQPLVGKEQARRYARSQNCRFVMLSNGNLHYFWDLERGNPYIITSFPTPGSVAGYSRGQPNPQQLIDEQVRDDYIVHARAVFDYFVGYKLGLTATPRDYLRGFDRAGPNVCATPVKLSGGCCWTPTAPSAARADNPPSDTRSSTE